MLTLNVLNLNEHVHNAHPTYVPPYLFSQVGRTARNINLKFKLLDFYHFISTNYGEWHRADLLTSIQAVGLAIF